MVVEAWPASIGTDVEISNFSQQNKPNTIRSSIPAGIDKIRRRYTKPIKLISFSKELTLAQYQTIELFHDVTLQGGIKRFNFPDPATGAMHEHRMISPPAYTARSGVYYVTNFQFERF